LKKQEKKIGHQVRVTVKLNNLILLTTANANININVGYWDKKFGKPVWWSTLELV